MQKKTKRKLNKKRFFGLLIFLAIGISFICYLLNLKVSNVLIIGNQEILDSTIIKASGLREYPYYKNIKKRMLEKEIGDIPLIDTVKVSKYLNGTIKIKVTEETPIVYLENTYKIFLLNTFISSILTAKDDIAVDFGNGAGMSLMDYSKKEWNENLLNAVSKDLKNKLGNIKSPSSEAGYITTYFIEKFGFNKNCIVGIGSGDNPETKVLYKGDILSLGTSFVYMLNIDENDRDYNGVSNTMYDGIGNPFMIFCRTNGAMLWDAIMNNYNKNYKDITISLKENINNLPLMLWQKENESVPISKSFEIKRYYEKANFDCDYKGIVLSSLSLIAEYSKKFNSSKKADLSVTGGPTKDIEILKIIANIWQCPIKILPSGGASLGAAISAILLLKENIDLDEIRESLRDKTIIEPDYKLSKKYEDYQKNMIEKFEELTK